MEISASPFLTLLSSYVILVANIPESDEIKYVDPVFKLFDRLTNMIPPNMQKIIRLGSILAWLILGTLVIFMSWQRGSDSAPQSGQDLSRAVIMERVLREQNLNVPPDTHETDTNELPAENQEQILPFESRRRGRADLAGEDSRLMEKTNTLEQPDTTRLPPFLGEERSGQTMQETIRQNETDRTPLAPPAQENRSAFPAAEPDRKPGSSSSRNRSPDFIPD